MDLLKPADLVDNFTRSLYKVAPYRGCAHGCRYCDGRAERYYVEGDFERDIVEKPDIPARLAADLPKARERGLVAFGSGTTDPYQPCEAASRITGACAELLVQGPLPPAGRLPALIMTKSALARRDLPLWKGHAATAGVVLLVSLTSLDEDLRTVMEPGASSFAERLELLRDFKAAGAATGILAMPFLPGLSDQEESIRRVYGAARELGVDFVMPGGLTLRPGRQKDLYLATLGQFRPDLLPGVEKIYQEARDSGAPSWEARKALEKILAPIRRDSDLPFLLPHKIFGPILPAHDSLRLLLRDMIELYADRSIDTSNLRRSGDLYDSWLVAKRREFRRARSLSPAWLEDALPQAARKGELRSLLDNPKLASFCESVILEDAYLDYVSLRLENRSP
jgi:DNA repair photolyase